MTPLYEVCGFLAKLCPTLATPWTVVCWAPLSMRFLRLTKFIESEIGVARGCGERSGELVFNGNSLGWWKNSVQWWWLLPKCTLKNGPNGKFYVMHTLLQLTTTIIMITNTFSEDSQSHRKLEAKWTALNTAHFFSSPIRSLDLGLLACSRPQCFASFFH